MVCVDSINYIQVSSRREMSWLGHCIWSIRPKVINNNVWNLMTVLKVSQTFYCDRRNATTLSQIHFQFPFINLTIWWVPYFRVFFSDIVNNLSSEVKSGASWRRGEYAGLPIYIDIYLYEGEVQRKFAWRFVQSQKHGRPFEMDFIDSWTFHYSQTLSWLMVSSVNKMLFESLIGLRNYPGGESEWFLTTHSLINRKNISSLDWGIHCVNIFYLIWKSV